ncbi:MAG TPA: phytanoyl-CoA dioxygenase family protein [Roseiflexaceae bacterium]
MNIKSALEALGVRDDTLTQAERDTLDHDGFLPLPGILTERQIVAFGTRLDELLASEGDDAGKEVHQEARTDRLSDLVNKGEIFEVCFTHPRVLAAVTHVLGADSSSHRSMRVVRCPARGCKHCMQTGVGRSRQAISSSVTRSGCWMTSPNPTAPHGSSLEATAAAWPQPTSCATRAPPILRNSLRS